MFVHPYFRGAALGTAKALWDVALEWARLQNISEIFLGTTKKFLAAHRFYEKNGFVSLEKESLPSNFPSCPWTQNFMPIQLNKAQN
jgi:GNAT superfamily N-acetyltransferase